MIESCTNCKVEKSVPASEFGYPLFDRLVSLHANHSKEKPARVLFATAPGFDASATSGDSFRCVDTDSVHVLALYVLFIKNRVQLGGAVDQFIARELEKGQLRVETTSVRAAAPITESRSLLTCPASTNSGGRWPARISNLN